MKRDGQELAVHCFFPEEGQELQELILQSLRFFIARNLQNHDVF
jgi:hypothetical protein